MNCPNCSCKMNKGFLQAGNLMAFNKQRHKISLNPKDKEDMMLVQKGFTASDFNGWICKECGLIVFDYKNIITRW